MHDDTASDRAASNWKVSEAARRLHQDALVWDNHAGFGPDPSVDLEMLETWRAAGVDYLSVDVGYDVLTWQQAVKNIAAFITWFEKHPDRFMLVQRADDILAAKRAGKMAIAFDLEGMNALDGESYMVSLFYRLGVRQMLFAYNRNNLAGGGCHDEDPGLTDFGRRVVEEMNRVGMMVDCSHTGYRTSMAVLEAALAPVIFSHSNPKALRPHGRNIVDEQIRACARTGGVVGINGIGLFLPDRRATTETMVDCLCYVADLVGVDHVGIGLDHAPPSPDSALNDLTGLNPNYWPASEGYSDPLTVAEPAQLPEITDRLLARGWSEADIRKPLGENFLRVARAVWK
jgi:membrane dipeptidase